MNRLALIALLVCSLFSSMLLADSELDPQAEALFHSKIEAIASNDYQKFLEHSDANFRQAISLEQFEALANSLSSQLEGGYQSDYLGVLNQREFKVYLWKIDPSRSASDSLVKMAIRESEIAGFWIE